MNDKVIILKSETLKESILSDVFSVIAAIFLVGIGLLVGSFALEIIGGVIFFVYIHDRYEEYVKKSGKKYSLKEARDEIDRMIKAQQA